MSTPAEPSSSSAARLTLPVFGPILAVHFLGMLGFSLAIPFLVFVVTDLGGASWTYGLVGATYSTFQFFGAPVLGRWSDSSGRRPVLVASQIGTFIAWVLFLVALSLPVTELFGFAGATITIPLVLVFVARALDGATGGNISVANAYVADLTKDTPAIRQKAFGRMGMASSLGFVIGPAAAGLLGGTSWGPRLPIAIAGVAALITTIAIIVFLREPKRKCPKGPAGAHVADAVLHQQDREAHPRSAERPAGLLTRRPILLALLGSFSIFLAFNVFFSAFPIYAADVYGWSAGTLGAFFAVLSGVMVVAQGPLLSLVARYLPGPVIFAIGISLLAVSTLLFLGGGLVLPYLGAVCFAVGNGIAWPTFQTRIAGLGGDHQGVVQGAASSASSLASIGGLVAGALLYPWLGGWLFVAAAVLFGLVAVLTPVWFARDDGGGGEGGQDEDEPVEPVADAA